MHRPHRFAAGLTSALLVAALLLKSAVPLLASAAAALQGKATAEVCDVYGVDTSMLRGRAGAATKLAAAADDTSGEQGVQLGQPAHHAHQVQAGNPEHRGHDAHEAHHPHGSHHAAAAAAAAAAESVAPAPAAPHGPSRVSHGGDHCALSALAFAAPADAMAVAAPGPALAPILPGVAVAAPVVDPAARWAAQLQHGPPTSS